MKPLGLIIQREYMSKIKTKAFILTTILMPFLFIIVTALPAYLMSINESTINTVFVVDNTGKFYNTFESSDKYTFIHIKEENHEGKTESLLRIDNGKGADPLSVTFFSEQQQPPQDLLRHIGSVLNDAMRNERLSIYAQSQQVTPEVVSGLKEVLNSKDNVQITTMRWDEEGKIKDTLGEQASLIGIALTLCMFMFIMMYGSIVMQSVVEEKSNRIIEVIISSVKPFDLMMGKIIGVALMGITQLIIWGVLIAGIGLVAGSFVGGDMLATMNSPEAREAFAASQGNSELTSIMEKLIQVNWAQVIICFVIYFIGGYLMFASLFAMFGSAANDAQEAQQFVMPVTILMFVAFYSGFAAARNPEGSLALWCSIIPFTSPIVMMVRTPFDVPFWQLALSIVLLYVTVYFMIQLSARIYRVGILMYGKKPSFKELFKWLRYK